MLLEEEEESNWVLDDSKAYFDRGLVEDICVVLVRVQLNLKSNFNLTTSQVPGTWCTRYLAHSNTVDWTVHIY